jgi:hypothetical protein
VRIEGVLHREDLDAVAAVGLARYRARSALRISRVGSGASSGNTAMPKLEQRIDRRRLALEEALGCGDEVSYPPTATNEMARRTR